MRPGPLAATLLLALALPLLAPAGLADQNVAAGPATAQTENATFGDGCDGENGAESRYAVARARLTADEEVFAGVAQSCTEWDWEYDDGHGNTHWSKGYSDAGSVTIGRSSRGVYGPTAHLTYYDHHEESSNGGWDACSTQAYASGPTVFLGCPPDGHRVPMAPLLP